MKAQDERRYSSQFVDSRLGLCSVVRYNHLDDLKWHACCIVHSIIHTPS